MALFFYLLLSAIIIGIDQWVKFWTVSNLALGETQPFIPKVLSLTYVQNTGAAWSILEGQMWFFYIITPIAVFAAIYFLIKNITGSGWLKYGISLVLAGALGNFIDRIRLNYVVDMFQTDFMRFPIFNVADSALVVGVVFILIYVLLEERKEKQHAAN